MNKLLSIYAQAALSASAKFLSGALDLCEKAVRSPRFGMVVMLLLCTGIVMAQNAAGDYSAGTTALGTVTTEIKKYVPVVVKLCYVIAAVTVVVGGLSVYHDMQNGEQDVKKKVMLLVGSCIFLIAAAQALPLFFGVE